MPRVPPEAPDGFVERSHRQPPGNPVEQGRMKPLLVKLECANRTQAGLLAHDAGLVSSPGRPLV